MFGPDGRLYVTEYTGKIKIFTVDRQGPGNYVVMATEVLNDIQTIQDYNDDGSIHSSANRETIGLTVVGTAANPVIYVTSSDFRIGGGGGGGNGDVGLDTNSGIITRFSWNGTAWDVVDIVRGLPRSEENHATNGLEFATVNGVDYLIVAQGGHTNAGAPSVNFAYTAEYVLSAAVLSINLDMINAMPILDDNGRKYIYDIPTLDDPSRPNKNGISDPDTPGYDGIDVNDPFGGNDGLNQAVIVPGGPVQIFSPGYRNAYDLVVTESGAVFVTDNGANGGWGGFPVNEGGGNANNNYDSTEPGSSKPTSDGEVTNNRDHLSLVTLDIQNYFFGSFYGGHPCPTRANPVGAGLYVNPSVTGNTGAVFRTLTYDPDGSRPNSTTDPKIALPANWPPVQQANQQEGDWRGPEIPNPDGPIDALVTTWGTNTNGIDEYTASNFEGAMKGNLIAGVNTGELRRVELNADGSLFNLTASFASGLGGNALGITCNSDSDPFPGTIWVGTLSGGLIVLEPQDFVICVQPGDSGYDPLADNDGDGYTNQDELDNGTDSCNGGSQPKDFDKAAGGTLVSDLNDIDDDNDGIPDSNDPFQLGDPLKNETDAFPLPVTNELFSDNPKLKGYMGLGMTGIMNNGDPNPNWLNWLDRRDDPNDPNPNDILGGAIGAMTMHMTAGTAMGTANNQEKGFQYGVGVDQSNGIFTVEGSIVNFDAPLQLYGNTSAPNGELGFFIGDGSQSNYIKFVATQAGLTVLQEINDSPKAPLNLPVPVTDRPNTGITFFFVVDPSSGNVQFEYRFDTGQRKVIGSLQAQGAVLDAVQNPGSDLAVGFIGTSNAEGIEVEGTWDYLNVTDSHPFVTSPIPDIEATVRSSGSQINLDLHFGDDAGVENLSYTVTGNTNPSVTATTTGNLLTMGYPDFPAVSDITVRATDVDGGFADISFKVTVLEEPAILYRVNAGGAALAAIDGKMDWEEDTAANNSAFLLEPGSNQIYTSQKIGYAPGVDQSTIPLTIFSTERWDQLSAPNMQYSFPVTESGNFEIRLYLSNGYEGTSSPGQRVFDIAIEGIIHPELDNIDLSAMFGHQIGGVISKVVEVTDGTIDISFIHVVENPLVNGIEILGAPGAAGSTPIQVAQMEDQYHVVREVLDGSLVVNANGGDGNLVYSMTGAPAGVTIEPTNGQIGGTIDQNADTGSPYLVKVVVDDEDQFSNDAVNTSFTWYITNGEPVVIKDIPDLLRTIDASNETLDLNLYFKDNDGVENILYTIEANSDPAVGVMIAGNLLTLDYPSVSAVSDITVRATDPWNNFAEQTFRVIVQENNLVVLYRINAGGAAVAAIDEGINWDEDTSVNNSVFLSEPGSNQTYTSVKTSFSEGVNQSTTPLSIYETERFDGSFGEPNLTYSLPVTKAGFYEIRLYMGNGWIGSSEPGQRIFDVSIEGIIHPELNDIDLSAKFGHQVGGVITKMVEVTDGSIDISFIHGIENPLLNGLEILAPSSTGNAIVVTPVSDQQNAEGDILDGSLAVSASGGDGSLVYSMSGAPSGVTVDSATGVISGTIASGAALASPFAVIVTVDDNDTETTDAVTTGFTWTITAKACEEVNKLTWYMDNDGDGLGDLNNSIQSCEKPLNYVSNKDDCDDTDPDIGVATIWYADKDGDGFGDLQVSIESCNKPADYLSDNTDCNDNDSTIYPGAKEISNDGIDQDCDGEDLIEVVYQGCTAQFWGGSSDWCSSYKPNDNFFSTFGITNKRGLGGKNGVLNLKEALAQKGGGFNKLAKQATAALLNACSASVNYQYSETQIKAEVQEAFNNPVHNNSYANSLASVYETANNAGCPSGQLTAVASKFSHETSIVILNEEPELEEALKIKLYPNPASTEVYLQVPNSSVKITAVALNDQEGKLIKTLLAGEDLVLEGNARYNFDISGMSDGVYVLKVFTESSGTFSLRLIKKN